MRQASDTDTDDRRSAFRSRVQQRHPRYPRQTIDSTEAYMRGGNEGKLEELGEKDPLFVSWVR
jgi:hypothetical protein